jgi:hypothetical protein
LQLQAQYSILKDIGPINIRSNHYKGYTYTEMQPIGGSDKELVLLQGVMRGGDSFLHLAYMMALKGWRVLMPPREILMQDLTFPYGLDHVAVQVLKFVKKVSKQKRYTILAHSLGALIGLRMCLIAREDVR